MMGASPLLNTFLKARRNPASVSAEFELLLQGALILSIPLQQVKSFLVACDLNFEQNKAK